MSGAEASFFVERDAQVWQGDIFFPLLMAALSYPAESLVDLPVGLSASQHKALTDKGLAGGRPRIQRTADPENWSGGKGDKQEIAVRAVVGAGMLLSHDCDFDKGRKFVSVAPVRAMSNIHERDRPTVRENRKLQFFYLPSAGPGTELERLLGGDSYVDLGLGCVVARDFISLPSRVASLSDLAVRALRAQVVAFVARVQLPGLSCPKCGHDFIVQEQAAPP